MTYSGVEVAYLDRRRMSMMERAMTEELREAVNLEALAADLTSVGWRVFKTSSYPEVILRFDTPKRGLAFWQQIHAAHDVCYIDMYLDSEFMGAPVIQGGVDVTSEPWLTALPIINRHYGLTVLRPHLGPGDAVWSVNHVHTPWVSHGREVVALLTDKAVAARYADLCRERHAELDAKNRELLAERGFDVTKMQDDETAYEIAEWTVDDPVVLRAIAGRGEVGTAEGK